LRTAMNGFRRTGIYPTDLHIFEDSDFDASLVTDNTYTSSAVGQTLPSLGQTSSAVAQTSTSVGQTSSAMGQTLPSLGQTSSAVAQTSVGQTSSAMGQTLPSLGQTSSLTGQAAQSLTSSNRATYVLANKLTPIPKQTRAGVRRGG
ncbi:hypothetical protein LSAT2_003552, partial [Lamellibrachia satsuma]